MPAAANMPIYIGVSFSVLVSKKLFLTLFSRSKISSVETDKNKQNTNIIYVVWGKRSCHTVCVTQAVLHLNCFQISTSTEILYIVCFDITVLPPMVCHFSKFLGYRNTIYSYVKQHETQNVLLLA